MIATLFREVFAGNLFAELVLGGALLLLTAIVHGVGVSAVILTYERQALLQAAHMRRHPFAAFSLLIVVLLATHLAEILLWALLFLEMGAIEDLRTAFYFASVTYTTLGYQDVPFPAEYRILPAMLSLAGVFMIGWTTGLLFAVTNGFIQNHVRRRLERDARKRGES
ncbi:MAG: potassium channel family protein [Burkholderiales bacterium]|jgi:hypothetical protein|nr:potassium channel family protein [Burkholderiales bacterium]